MGWWVWLVAAVIVIAVLFGSVLAVQARRRRGRVIVVRRNRSAGRRM
ncbi:hypothetical protein ABZ858_20275 [Streptomyces sp. NPDC047017]